MLNKFFKLILIFIFLSGANIIESIKSSKEFNEIELNKILPVFNMLKKDSLELFNAYSLSTKDPEQLKYVVQDTLLLKILATEKFEDNRIDFLKVLYATLIHNINCEIENNTLTTIEIVEIAKKEYPEKHECLHIIATKLLELENSPSSQTPSPNPKAANSPSPQKPSPQLLRRSSSISVSNQSSGSLKLETSEKKVSVKLH